MKRKIATKDLVLTALFAALTAVLAQIQLPIGPVPFNLAVFGAFLAGMLLEPAWAAASMGVSPGSMWPPWLSHVARLAWRDSSSRPSTQDSVTTYL